MPEQLANGLAHGVIAAKRRRRVQAQQVESFRQRRGRLPDALREAGEPLPGMTYERIDAGTYRLSGATERMTVVWTPADTLDTRTRETVARLPRVGP